MGIIELFFLAIALSMDAFAVSICKGLSMKQMKWSNAVKAGLYFGIFQAVMPLIGYFFGFHFQSFITNIDHWIAFVLLTVIGINMIRESFQKAEELDDSFSFRSMIILSVATSIDALAVGVTFAFLNTAIIPAVSFIGIVTFCFSFAGIKIGNVFGIRYKNKAELCGGIILILIGLKILLEHLGIVLF